MTVYLSVPQAVRFHSDQVRRFGGATGLRDRAAVESAVARPRMTFDGEDLYSDVPTKAAALMHSLVANHAFVDGNKRVGAHAAVAFLLVNDFEPLFSAEDLVNVTIRLAEGRVSAEELAIWIRQRSRALDV